MSMIPRIPVAPVLTASLLTFATSGSIAAPALANSGHDGGHAPASVASASVGGAGTTGAQSKRQIAVRKLALGHLDVTARLFDARAYFKELHKEHLGHPGIPTHQVIIRIAERRTGKRPSRAVPALVVRGPGGLVLEPALDEEADAWQTDLALEKPGRYTFVFKVKGAGPPRTARWSVPIR